MKNFKKKIALLAALACAGTMLAGCTSSNGGTDGNSGGDTPAAGGDNAGGNAGGDNAGGGTAEGMTYDEAKTAGTGNVDTTNEGKVLNIYCWNDEFKGFFDSYYTVPDGITVNWITTPSEGGAYQTALDQALMNNESAAADDKVDMFLAEADYIIKYANADVTMDVTKIGVQNWGKGYDYTYNAATSTSGVLKGVSFQGCPSAVIYRRSIAKDVLGTDDPAEVQEALSTWDKVDEVAAKAKEKGYTMFASAQETYRAFANNATESYLNGDKFALTSAFNDWLAQQEKYVANGWSVTNKLWSDEKNAQMGTNGTNMCFMGPAWYYTFSMGTALEETPGDWAICVGPAEHFWGGTWLLAAAGTDNEKTVADIMNAFTVNEDICEKLLVNDMQFPNNKAVVEKYAADASYQNDFLGGQNDIAILAEVAKGITWNPALHTQYDQTFNEVLPDSFLEYLQGTVDKDTALNNFYIQLSEVAPQITHD